MELENLDFESIMDARRKAVERSIRPVTVEELNSLCERLVPDLSHPWSALFHQFLDENAGNTFYHAETDEHVDVVYCRAREKGIWFIPGVGIGLMQALALNAMKEIVDARRNP